MTQIKLIVNSLPRDLAEFSFFLIIGFTAGSMGLIWKYFNPWFYKSNIFQNNTKTYFTLFLNN